MGDFGFSTFYRYTVGLHQVTVLINCVTVKVAPCFVLIGAFWSSFRLSLIGGLQSTRKSQQNFQQNVILFPQIVFCAFKRITGIQTSWNRKDFLSVSLA